MKICQFEDNYLEAYFPDNTKLSLNYDSIIYYSIKGSKAKINIKDVYRSPQLHTKLTDIFNICNQYNDKYLDLEMLVPNSRSQPISFQDKCPLIKKSYKIQQFVWNQETQLIASQTGFSIKSQDNNATVTLLNNLYTIEIDYLQLCSGKQFSKSNITKSLLQKYNYSYTEFPVEMYNNKTQFRYRHVKKIFTIFNLPVRWYKSLFIIWNHLLTKKLIPYSFCYIDLEEQELINTAMPKLQTIQQSKNNQEIGIPILGRLATKNKCKWVNFQEKMQIWYGEANVMSDGFGFWFIDGNSFVYKKINRQDHIDKKYHNKAIPRTIRIEGQQQRQISNELAIFYNYQQENSNKAQIFKKYEQAKTNQDNANNDVQLIIQQQIPNIVSMKAYSNKMVVGKFIDKSMITLRSNNTIKIVDPFSQIIETSLESQFDTNYRQYTEHLTYLIQFKQKIFDQQSWKERQQMLYQLEQKLLADQMFMQKCKIEMKYN